MIKLYEFDALQPEKFLNRDLRAERDVEAAVDEIMARVRQEGDAALLEYAEKFDKARLDSLEVTEAELQERL